MAETDWRVREGRLAYEVAVYAYEKNLLGLAIDREKAMDIMIDGKSAPIGSGLRRAYTWSGLVGFGIMAAALILSFTWHWWAFLLGILASIIYWQAGKKIFTRLMISEGLKYKDLYNYILDKDGWYFSTLQPLAELDKMYEDAAGSGTLNQP